MKRGEQVTADVRAYDMELRKAKGLCPDIPGAESERRLKRCRELMKEEGFDAIFVYGNPWEPFWVRYLANYVHPIAVAESFFLLSAKGEAVLFIDRAHTLDCAKEMSWIKDVRVYPYLEFEWQAEELVSLFRNEILGRVREDSNIGLCRQTMPIKYDGVLKKALPKAEFGDATDLLFKTIEEKSNYDVEMMGKVASIADEAMQATLEACKEGVKEYEPALIAHSIIASKGGEIGPATLRTHGPYIASSSNILSSCRPYFYTGKRLAKGEMFLIDLGVCYNGYYCDMCRTVSIGRPSVRQREIFEAVVSMHATMVQKLRPGVTGGEIWERMLGTAQEKNFLEATKKRAWSGHGVGVRLPEPPFIGKGQTRAIKSRTFMNIEPGLHFLGVSASIEDMLFVTEKGAEFITQCSRELHIG